MFYCGLLTLIEGFLPIRDSPHGDYILVEKWLQWCITQISNVWRADKYCTVPWSALDSFECSTICMWWQTWNQLTVLTCCQTSYLASVRCSVLLKVAQLIQVSSNITWTSKNCVHVKTGHIKIYFENYIILIKYFKYTIHIIDFHFWGVCCIISGMKYLWRVCYPVEV